LRAAGVFRGDRQTRLHDTQEGEPIMHGFKRAYAAMAAMAVALAAAGGAGAAGGLDPVEPPAPIRMPNLAITAASVTPYGATQWQIHYTMSNRGTGPAPVFDVAVQENGTTLMRDTAYGPLAAGASRSENVLVPRTSCYVPVRVVADSIHAVAESPKYDNERWAVGLTATACPSLPKYKVKALSFHAVDESGTDWLGSDEPYWIFNAVGLVGTQRTTASHVFGNIDTGDTANFNAIEGCAYLSCDGGAAPFGIGFSIQLWEHDHGDPPTVLTNTAKLFYGLGSLLNLWDGTRWAGESIATFGTGLNLILNMIWADDLLGSQTYAYDPAYLASRLPTVGAGFTDTRTYEGVGTGSAVYTMTLAVVRVG
jgi:hypothetical protein